MTAFYIIIASFWILAICGVSYFVVKGSQKEINLRRAIGFIFISLIVGFIILFGLVAWM